MFESEPGRPILATCARVGISASSSPGRINSVSLESKFPPFENRKRWGTRPGYGRAAVDERVYNTAVSE